MLRDPTEAPLQPSEIHLAACPCATDDRLNLLGERLHPGVVVRLSRFRSAAQRNQTILGRALLVLALRDVGFDADLRDLGDKAEGGPLMPDGSFGSIAHSDETVGAVATRVGPVGLDIEHRWQDFACLERRVPPVRCVHVDLTCDCAPRAWASCEAIAKVSGRSLTDMLVSDLPYPSKDAEAETFVELLEIAEGTFAAVATTGFEVQPRARWLSFSEISERLLPARA